jgi:hypothetical protein
MADPESGEDTMARVRKAPLTMRQVARWVEEVLVISISLVIIGVSLGVYVEWLPFPELFR